MLNEQVFSKNKTRTLALVLSGVLGVLPAAWAGSDDLRYAACAKCEPQNLVWSSGLFQQVYLMPGQHQNAQPQVLNASPLAVLLNKITIQSGKRLITLFDEEAAKELAEGLVEAMKKATPKDDILFFITSRGNGGPLSSRAGNSGVAFIDEKGLNLIFGEANVDFFGTYKATRVVRPFYFGSRTEASKVVLRSEGVTVTRGDSVLIPLAASYAPPPIPLTVGGSATPQGVGNLPPATISAPKTPSAPIAARDEQYFQAQEMRLKSLKRLHDQGLITDEEYKAKRNEILKDL